MSQRCATIAVIGRPNVGKSTLINRLVRSHLSITSPKPQTTRVAIRVIVTRDDCQLVFIDNPGFSRQRSLLDRKMRRFITDSILGSDIIVCMTEITDRQVDDIRQSPKRASVHPGDRMLLDEILRANRKPDVVVINKIDKLKKKEVLLPLITLVYDTYETDRIVPMSARKGTGVDPFLHEVMQLAPEKEFMFDPDFFSDRPERFFVAEYVREAIFLLTQLEVPYSSSVAVTAWNEEENRLRIDADIAVERDSQKGIIIGKGGKMLKEIGTRSRKEIEKFLGRGVYLALRVVVKPDWRDNAHELDRVIEGE
ncbi:MAG: GTPase Era [Pseudomonadota bacterium]